MNARYELEVRSHCPHAAIVFDLFHVVANHDLSAVYVLRDALKELWRYRHVG